jgi:acyl dehydratase
MNENTPMSPILRQSEEESRRFGLRVFRGRPSGLEIKELGAELWENQVDVAFLRLPSDRMDEFPLLDQLPFPWLVADTLVYYRCALEEVEPKPLRNLDLEFIPCTREHQDILDELVAEIFSAYRNHYTSNPFLPTTGLLTGYQEWVSSFLETPERLVWLALLEDQPVAFATCSFDHQDSSCEGVLFGVRPNASGRGVYGDLIRYSQAHFKKHGFREMRVSTQVQNFAVQRVWSRESYSLRESLNTIHINCFLDHSEVEKRFFELTIRPDQIVSFAEASGDRNPLHFDDAFARSRGFEGRIAHGLISNGLLSRYFGTEFPGPGTIFGGYRYRFLRPLYPHRSYRVEIGFPRIAEKRGYYLGLAKVYDEDGELCMLSYNDLFCPSDPVQVR